MKKKILLLTIALLLCTLLFLSCATTTPSLDVYQLNYNPATDTSVVAILDEFRAVDTKIPDDLQPAWEILKRRIGELQPYRTIFMQYNGDNSANISVNNLKSGRLQITSLITAGVTTASGVVAAAWIDSVEIQIASKSAVILGGLTTVIIDAFNAAILQESKGQKDADDRNKSTKARIDESVTLIHNHVYIISTLDKTKNKSEIQAKINELKKDIDSLEKAYIDAGLLRIHK